MGASVNILGYQLAEWINAFTDVEGWGSRSRLEVPRPRPCACQCWVGNEPLGPTRAHLKSTASHAHHSACKVMLLCTYIYSRDAFREEHTEIATLLR